MSLPTTSTSETPPVAARGESEKKEGQTMTISQKISERDASCEQSRAVRDAFLLAQGVTVLPVIEAVLVVGGSHTGKPTECVECGAIRSVRSRFLAVAS